MSPSIDLPEPVVIPVSSFHYCHFDEPDPVNNKYGFALPWQDLPERVADVLFDMVQAAKASKWGLVNLRTNRPPRIYGMKPDNSDMIDYRQRTRSLNMPPFMGLIGQPGEAFVSFWEKTNHPTPGALGVSLNCIRFDPSKIVLPRFDEMPRWSR